MGLALFCLLLALLVELGHAFEELIVDFVDKFEGVRVESLREPEDIQFFPEGFKFFIVHAI